MLFHENQRRIQSLLRDCTKAESRNGKPRPKRATTKEDLDALYDAIFHGKPLPPREPDPETDAYLGAMYDRIVQNQIEEGQRPPDSANGHR
jgi:hypothetical protein